MDFAFNFTSLHYLSDKAHSFVIVDKETYINRMENLLSNQRKFEKVTLKNNTFLNFVVNQEKRLDTIFKNLVDSNSISNEIRKSVKPVGTRPGVCTRFFLQENEPQKLENLKKMLRKSPASSA